MNKKENCFSLIRLVVSLSVVYQHARISGFDLPQIKFIDWIDKVPIFFFISAYSISMSLDNKNQTFKQYGMKRFLRLFPELWISILLETIIIAIQFPNLLKEVGFYVWLIAQLTLFQFYTPNCLRDYGNGTPNGSLWTNIVFIQFYLLVYYAYKKIKKLNLFQDLFILVILIAINSLISFLDGNINGIIYKLILQTIFPYLYMFYLGIVFYKYSNKLIPFVQKYFWIISFSFIILSKYNYVTNFIPHTSNTGTVIHVIICCIFFFAFAYRFPNIEIRNDYSYGVYIYHMIVMNFFVQNDFINNDYITLLIVYILTFLLSIFSNEIIKRIKFEK